MAQKAETVLNQHCISAVLCPKSVSATRLMVSPWYQGLLFTLCNSVIPRMPSLLKVLVDSSGSAGRIAE